MNTTLSKLKKKLKQHLNQSGVYYGDMRFDEVTSTSIAISGNEVEDAKTFENLGCCARVLKSNGWGFVCFSNPEDGIEKYIEAEKQSSLIKSKKIKLHHRPVIKKNYKIAASDPADKYTLSDKFRICKKYHEILKKQKGLQTVSVRYKDIKKIQTILTTDGCEVVSETSFCGISVAAIARDGGNIQTAYHSEGDFKGFTENILNKEKYCYDVAERARMLLKASPVKPGRYTVVIDPQLCGVFTHEAFGHLSEADFVYENSNLKRIMKIGKRFGCDELNIIDDPTIPYLAGSYMFDEECTKSKKNYLIKNGILTGRLHSRETAESMQEEPTGNCRAINYGFQPIVRMSNTYLDKGKYSFNEIISKTENGIYAKGSLGGMTNTEQFTFSSAEAFLIENGKITKPLRDVILSGNVFETLKNIDMIGNDLKLHGGLGGCGKGAQSPLPVSDGGPHIRIKDVVIGGK